MAAGDKKPSELPVATDRAGLNLLGWQGGMTKSVPPDLARQVETEGGTSAYANWDVGGYDANPVRLGIAERHQIDLSINSVTRVDLPLALQTHNFFAGGRFRPHALDVVYGMRIDLEVLSLAANTTLTFLVDIGTGGQEIVILRANQVLPVGGNVLSSLSFSTRIYCAQTFQANGGSFELVANAPVELRKVGLVLEPRV